MQTTNLAIEPTQSAFTPAQVAALRQMGCEKATDADLAVLFHISKRTGLDPFAKQVYMVGRWDARAQRERYTIQTGIDGYRLIADRTGVYAGSDEVWAYDANGELVSATVTVRKVVAGVVCTFSATAHWNEYAQTTKDGRPSGLWARMGQRMLAKCAEANALRKAFPADLSGLYTDEEMQQADAARATAAHVPPVAGTHDDTPPAGEVVDNTDAPASAAPSKAISDAQVRRIHALKTKLGITDEQYRRRLSDLYGVASSKDLTRDQASDLVKRLESVEGGAA